MRFSFCHFLLFNVALPFSRHHIHRNYFLPWRRKIDFDRHVFSFYSCNSRARPISLFNKFYTFLREPMNYSIKKNNKCQENTLFLWFLPKNNISAYTYIIHHFIHKCNTFYYFMVFEKSPKLLQLLLKYCVLHTIH